MVLVVRSCAALPRGRLKGCGKRCLDVLWKAGDTFQRPGSTAIPPDGKGPWRCLSGYELREVQNRFGATLYERNGCADLDGRSQFPNGYQDDFSALMHCCTGRLLCLFVRELQQALYRRRLEASGRFEELTDSGGGCSFSFENVLLICAPLRPPHDASCPGCLADRRLR